MSQYIPLNEDGSGFSEDSYYDENASSLYCYHDQLTMLCDICNRVSGLWLVFPLDISLTQNDSLPLSEAVLPSLNISMATTSSVITIFSQLRAKATAMMIKTNLSPITGSSKKILSPGRLQRSSLNVSTQGSGWLDWGCLKIRTRRPNHNTPKKSLGSRTWATAKLQTLQHFTLYIQPSGVLSMAYLRTSHIRCATRRDLGLLRIRLRLTLSVSLTPKPNMLSTRPQRTVVQHNIRSGIAQP